MPEMPRRLLTSIVMLALACACTGTADAAKTQKKAKAHVMLGGINVGGIYAGENLETIDSFVSTAKSLHAKVIRVDMQWAQFEPSGPGEIDPETVVVADRLMQDAASAHIKVIALAEATPCWASTAPPATLSACTPSYPGEASTWPPKMASDYSRFVGWLARQYGSRLAAIEVWNEPDQANQDYLKGKNKPQQYAKLVRAAYPAVKHANPHVKVIIGSLVGSNGAFMNALYKAGIKGYYDGVAVHFYTLGLGSLRVFHENQLKHHDHKPLWFDEFGWSSCWPKEKIQQEQGCVTEAIQAQNLANTFKELAHTSWIAAVTSYDLQDSSKEDFGVLNAEGRRKPAFNALSQALRNPFGKPSPVKLKLKAKHGQVIATGSGPVGDYMKLEAFQGGRLRYRAVFSMNRFNKYSVKLPRALGSHGLTVRVWQYWQGPKQGAQRSI